MNTREGRPGPEDEKAGGDEARVSAESMGDWRRTHLCGALRGADAGAPAVLMGWVQRTRDHGGVVFIDLRDHSGLTQVVFHPGKVAEEA